MKDFRRLLIFCLVLLSLVYLGNLNLDQREKVDLVSPSPRIPTSTYRFAVFSDIHSDLPNLQKALDKAREDKVEFIIITGDLTMVGKTQELRKVREAFDKSGLTFYAVPGNHDLWSVNQKGHPFREVFGADFQSFKKGQIKFILVNNGDGIRGVEGINFSGMNQGEWLREEIAECVRIYCLVFTHMPLNHSLLKHVMGENGPSVASQAARLVRQFTNYQVKELFAGHVHFTSSYELDGLKTTTVGPIFSNKGTQTPRFLEVTISQPEIKLEKKEVWLE